MDFMECIKSRRSVRKYKSDKVPMECIRKAVEAASFAPSWKNSQVTRYYAVTTEEIKEKVADFVPSFNQPAIKSAPVLMVVTVIKQRSGYNREGQADTSKGDGWQMYDCGASNMQFCLSAKEQGLGTVIMGYFDEIKIAEVLSIPDTEEVAALISLGYPDEEPEMPKRKEVDVLLKEI